MKKFLVIFLVIILSAVGCSSKSSKPVLRYINIGTPPADLELVNKEISKYLQEKNAAYDVKMEYIDWGDYEKKLQVIVNSGESWDLAFIASWAGPYTTLVNNGALLDVTDLLNNEGKTTKDLIASEQLLGASVNDKLFAIPAGYDTVVATNYFLWNKMYVDKYNIPYKDIHSLSDLEPWLVKIKDAEKEIKYPLKVSQDFLVPTIDSYDRILDPFGISYEGDDLKVVNIYDQANVKTDFELMRTFYDAGLVNKDGAQTTAGQKVSTTDWLVAKAEGEPGAEPGWSRDFSTPIVAAPILDKVYVSSSQVQGKMIGISSQSKYSKEAMYFINKMNVDSKLQDLLCYGIEGTHYKVVDGKIEDLPDTDKYRVPAFTFQSAQNRTLRANELDRKTDVTYQNEIDDYIAKLTPSNILGFQFDAQSVKTEVANISNVMNEFKVALNTGGTSDDYIEQMNTKLKAAGIDKVITEMQAQIDAWVKTK